MSFGMNIGLPGLGGIGFNVGGGAGGAGGCKGGACLGGGMSPGCGGCGGGGGQGQNPLQALLSMVMGMAGGGQS